MPEFGEVELNPNFEIICSHRKTKKWQVVILGIAIIFISILAILLWTYPRKPLQVDLSSEKKICLDALIERPVFLSSGMIVFGQLNGDVCTIYSYDAEGNKKREIYSDSAKLYPTDSQDDKAISLTIKNSSYCQIAIMSLDRPVLHILTSPILESNWPCFSSVFSNKIYFQASEMNKNYKINIKYYSENYDDPINTVDMVNTTMDGRHPDCSPTKDEIVFESDVRGVSNIYRRTGYDDAKNITMATKGIEGCYYPSFSPDGKWILFNKGGNGLWIMKRNGKRQKQILKGNSPEMRGRISPDGTKLAVFDGKNLLLYNISFPSIANNAN